VYGLLAMRVVVTEVLSVRGLYVVSRCSGIRTLPGRGARDGKFEVSLGCFDKKVNSLFSHNQQKIKN
jgi:hypothetical protein